MSRKIALQAPVTDLLKRCIKEACGKEIAGFLMENREEEQHFYLINNLAASGDRFFVSDYDYRLAITFAGSRRLKLRAFIHSHHSGLHMSGADKRAFEKDDLSWLIVMYQDGELSYAQFDPLCKTE